VAQRNYHMLTVEEYGKILEAVGFKNVSTVHNTHAPIIFCSMCKIVPDH
jgi:hypothetical protein